MEGGEAVELRAPRYPGEDTRETSKREIQAWYCYGLAAEVFAVCGVGELQCSQIFYTHTKLLQAHSSQLH
jgi:UMF1 family MFS transporter